ncbi:hypothetical protein [Cytobacillus purgationiresistens]|uniref:Membrane protein YGL010W n=1 Tax=Cytobacillus purgationiresistens TaxID=863449 RepID=A0ABU0ABF7_9BACI|nr:hypothetical protein [Cytobacillus purgationiresistens]MDQ0268586.1 putative membrane protein YGL010W [Cytobacillus purgationiresistens]
MKTLEIKRFTVGTVIKSTLYLLFIPIIIMIIVGLITTMVLMIEDGAVALMGIFIMLLASLFYAGVYLGMIALMTVIYNWLAGKFGGLTIIVQEKDEIVAKEQI